MPAAIDQFKRLKQAFPQLPIGFYDILLDRIKENGFTDARLKDAIDHLIDNFIYPVPTVANIVGFDKRVKLYTYLDIIEFVNQHGVIVWNIYKPVETLSKHRLFASIEDIEKYNLHVKT